MLHRHAHFLMMVSSAAWLACGDDKAGTADTGFSDDEVAGDVFFPDATSQDTDATTGEDSVIVAGGFGAACQANADCLDGYCVEGPEGFICTKGCDEECPGGYDCRGVQSGSADTVFLCLPRVAKVCIPCKADYQCTGGACLAIGGKDQCATGCEDDNGCPGGYTCLADGGGTREGKFCQPRSGSCDCTPDFAGAVRTCIDENAVGTCYGVETCDPAAGWQGCTAAEPIAEICDGRDNDCNALVDDGLENNVPCENETPGIGVCSGVRVCVGTQGYVCTAGVPAVEACDFVDNDCDGEIDNVPGRGEACVNESPEGSCPGVNVCQDGALICLGKTPSAEKCNYEDDDCDGETDNGFPGIYQSCSEGVGVCERFGTVLCNDDGTAAACNVVAGPDGDERCDGLDNDCDGESDEDFGDVGEVCSSGVGVCRGFGTRACKADGSGSECDAVTGTASAEACDLLDNNCDGATDEAFKSAQGKYNAATACGNCFTDCTVIFDKPNASGSCDAVPALPQCKMVCDSGYYDLNGVPDDGCEFQLESTAIYVSESDPAAANDASCGGGPTATGGNRKPCKTITYGIQRAEDANKTKVLVAGGAYNEGVRIKDGISVYGGYNPKNWTRDFEANLTAVFGVQTSGHRKTVIADTINQRDTVFDGFNVYGQVANGLAENSYAIYVKNSNGKLRISNNTLWPGTGGPGGNGNRGNNGQNGGDGAAGKVARETSTPATYCFETCTGTSTGGTGGVNSACGAGTGGGPGGTARCPDFNEDHNFCTDGTVFSAVQTNNTGGSSGSGTGGGGAGTGGCDQQQGPTCVCFVPGTVTNCANGQFAGSGGVGTKGVPGAKGNANASTVGSVTADEWVGVTGGPGGSGVSGSGGGGGGAGGSVEGNSGCADAPDNDGGNDFGGSGGGGGAGGCGGTGGVGGGSGGGAFGIFYVVTLGFGTNLPVIVDNDIHLGFGGLGGRGGDGGTAGLGGNGGLGGAAAPEGSSWCAKPGAQGGEGGDGGPGGGGSGGNGGVAYGLYAGGGSLEAWKTQNAYYLDGRGGAGGAGGGTGAGGNAGADGNTGTASQHNL